MTHEDLTRSQVGEVVEVLADDPGAPPPAKVEAALNIVIASTFTADPIQRPLRYWMTRLHIPSDVQMAPYAQVIQSLLDPDSAMSSNTHGFNVLLLRLEDWIRDRDGWSIAENQAHLAHTSEQLVGAIRSHSERSRVPLLIYFAPSFLPAVATEVVAGFENVIIEALRPLANVHCLRHADLVSLYPVSACEDRAADVIGHIPYAADYFAAIATLLARRIAALVKPRVKVIAVDCDNTLWKGVCGEDGWQGVELTSAHVAFQRLLVRQHDDGVLLCLCTKNNPADVEAVFEHRTEMPLRREHLIATRINWEPKSANLRSLAEELDLSIDSFMLIDDSPMECSEVKAHCPSVLTSLFPQEQTEVSHFLAHTWAFDRVGVTEESRKRTEKYKENRKRSEAQKAAASLEDFLASLQLEVVVAPMEAQQLSRVAELIQRTSQFNINGLRRSLAEIERAWRFGELEVLVCHVRDRFGDYGLVGAVLFRQTKAAIEVDAFVLSCRALGRGVEQRIVEDLAQMARERGCHHIVLQYRRTPRNVPAGSFLQRWFAQFGDHSERDGSSPLAIMYTIPVGQALVLRTDGSLAAETLRTGTRTNQEEASATAVSTQWHDVAYSLSRLADLLPEIVKFEPQISKDPDEAYVAPRTAVERSIADAWASVLGVPEIGIYSDFFNLGGDSLLAVQVLARIEATLGKQLTLFDLFEEPTIAALAAKIDAASSSNSGIPRIDRDSQPLPLSSTQRRLWFIDELEHGSPAYHVPVALQLAGPLDADVLQHALDTILSRHEALRTVFAKHEGEPVQQIVTGDKFSLRMIDLVGLDKSARESAVAQHLADELATPFVLSQGPLVRGRLLRFAADDHLLLVDMHHIVSDGWSVGLFVDELVALYVAAVHGRSDPLPPLPIQYVDYARWHRQWSLAPKCMEQLEYWTRHLKGAPTLLELPTARPRPAVQSYRGGNALVHLPLDLADRIKCLARSTNATLAMVLYSAWAIVLSRLSNHSDIVIGMPVANRRRTEVESLMGLFANTLAVRVSLEGDPTVRDLLQQVRSTMLGAYEHQDVPFEHVVEALQPVRSLSHAAVFQVMFALQRNVETVREMGEQLLLTQLEAPLATAQFDLTLSLRETTDGIVGTLNYAADLFDGETIERWVGYFTAILAAMVEQPDSQIGQIQMMSGRERLQLLEEFNGPKVEYENAQPVHRMFERCAALTPDAVAIVSGERQLSYSELNMQANRLARELVARGVQPDDRVAVCVERGLDMVVGWLAVLKAGGAYVPIDISYPTARIDYMLKDSAPIAALVHEGSRGALPLGDVPTIALDKLSAEVGQWCEDNRAPALDEAHRLAYVIYTSGSTGQPKGVMIPHTGLSNLVCWHAEAFRVGPGARTSCVAAVSFDAATWEIWSGLCNGATVLLAPAQVATDPEGLLTWWQAQNLQVSFLPTPIAELLLSRQLSHPTLHTLLVGGDRLRLHPGKQSFEVINNYGPTEASVVATSGPIAAGQAVLHIGRPIANTRAYVLDKHRQPVPVGVTGELYIGGAGTARGYLGNRQLTGDRFIHDPFVADSSARMYRTGDLVRWRGDGTLEYVGRNDSQVKIRGLRIETGEIEAQLLRHDDVAEAVIVAQPSPAGDIHLIGYAVPKPHAPSINPETLRAHLKAVLPQYMIPSALVVIERLPLTANGKIDYRSLPRPALDDYATREYEPPQGRTEQMLVEIWRELMHVERVGRNDHFFELGGHSLLAVRLIDRLRKIGLHAEVRWVFDCPKVADLAVAIDTRTASEFTAPPNLIPERADRITPEMLPLLTLEAAHIERIVESVPGGAANIEDIYPLAPLQEGLLFHHLRAGGGADTYVLPTLLEISSRQRLDELIGALQSLIDRHDVLRTGILWDQLPMPVQVVHRKATLPVAEVELDPARPALDQVVAWMNPALQSMDLRRAPLLRLQIAPDPRGERWYAMLQLHHIVGDNVLQDIVISEVTDELEGRVPREVATVPYRNHIAFLQAYARTHDAAQFFTHKLRDVTEPTAPFSFQDVHVAGQSIDEAHERIDADLTAGLRQQAKRLGVSAATIVHAAFSLVLAHTTGRDDVVFGSVLLGRTHSTAGAQRMLGIFINTLPLHVGIGHASAEQLVKRTNQELLETLDHEHASLAVAQRCSGVDGLTPLFTALLNYRHRDLAAEANWSRARGVRELARHARTNYPISLIVDDFGHELTITAQTVAAIDPARMAGYFLQSLRSLVAALAAGSSLPALRLSMLPPNESRQLLEVFNSTEASYSKHRRVHDLFAGQAKRTPQAVALMHGEDALSYAELEERASKVARHLQAMGVGCGQIVGVCAERSMEMVIGVLGALKCGAAYLPLDPAYPAERLIYMLEDAAPSVVLTHRAPQLALTGLKAQVIEIAAVLASADLEGQPEVASGQGDAVYVIYTSGSTGRPKGTVMPHAAMVNLLEWHRRTFAARSTARVLQFAALSFDVAFQEIFSTLCTGGTLVMVDDSVRKDARKLTSLLRTQRVQRLFMPPVMLQSLAEYWVAIPDPPEHIEDVITAGEQLRITAEIVATFRRLETCTLHNHYGPTETHVVTALTLSADPADWPTLPSIGAPIANTRIYILNSERQLVPHGVAGEIYIAGAGLARGYLNRPELTAERFVSDPFSAEVGSRMYRTGDLGRWRSDGTIEYLGRNDGQVKIRGFRVELGEIEAVLAAHPDVKEAAVVARADSQGEQRLVGYVTARSVATLDTETLRAHLKANLPEQMVPAAFLVLDKLPLTPSGKLDRRALPAPDASAWVNQSYEAPEGEVEQALAEIWKAVLKVERVGRNDDFFRLGGHSLSVLKLMSRIELRLRQPITVTEIYNSPTLRSLAERLSGVTAEQTYVDRVGEAELTDDIVAVSGGSLDQYNILLTGATEFVGGFLLAQLLAQLPDATFYCPVNARSVAEATLQVKSNLMRWNLWRDEFARRVVTVTGDHRAPRLGVNEHTYAQLCERIDTIYHCAANMGILQTYALAKTENVDPVRHLLALATTGRVKRINHISTLGVFSAAPKDPVRVIREDSPLDAEQPFVTSRGYVASRWISEKMLMTARERKIACNIFRVGLIWADSEQGRYDEQLFGYTILKSCLLSGYGIKDYRYPMPPTPIDYVARSIAALAAAHDNGTFHISTSQQAVSGVFERCAEIAGMPLQLVPYYDWVQKVKQLHRVGRSLPIVPLVQYAFSLDRETFEAYQRNFMSAVNCQFDLTLTHGVLESAGIFAPTFDERMLRACLDRMFSEDEDLRNAAREPGERSGGSLQSHG